MLRVLVSRWQKVPFTNRNTFDHTFAQNSSKKHRPIKSQKIPRVEHHVENIGVEPMTSSMPWKRSSQLS